jgi:hypothetical protein
MARIPIYDGPQVQQAALQPVYQRTPDVSSGTQALARAVGQVGEAFEAKANRDAEAEANKVDTDITARWIEWDTAAKRDPNMRGQNIDQYEAGARKFWADAEKEVGAASPMAQRRLRDAVARKQNAALGSALGYVTTEKERFADDAAEASVQSTIEFGIDTGSPAGAAAEVRKITAQQAARKGWTSEQAQAEMQRRLGTLHLAYVTRLAESNPEAATQYYEANKGEIPGTVQGRVEQDLKGERDNQFAKAEAVRIYALPSDERAAALASIKDPDRLAKTRTEFANMVAIEKVAQQEREAKASDDAWQLVGQGQRVPERTLRSMNGRERVQLQDYLKQRAEHAATKGNAPVKTDPASHAALWEMATRDPEAFKKERLQAHAMKLAQGDLEQLYKMQQGMLNPKAEGDIVKWNNKVTARLEMLRMNTGSRNEAARGQFRTAAQKEFEAYQRNNGKAPDPKAEDEILDRLSLPGKSGLFSGGDAATYAESVATGKKFVPKISSEDRDAIRQAFISRGVKNPNDEQINAAYKRMKGL